MENIEVEVRSFISEDKYNELAEFFKKNAVLKKDDYQETFYFDCEEDLRIQRNDSFAKVWLKKGQIHDRHREEIEVKFDRDEFEKLEKLFLALGYQVEIKWFRKRLQFDWEGIKVCLDHTKSFGYVIELEKMTSEENQGLHQMERNSPTALSQRDTREKTVEQEFEKLREKLKSLDVEISPREEFEKMFEYYKNNWKVLTKGG